MLHKRKQKDACHGVTIEDYMTFLYSKDEDPTAENGFSSCCCFPVLLMFHSVLMFLLSSFYTGFDLS